MAPLDNGTPAWRIHVARTRQPVAEHAILARTLGSRLRGLLGRDTLPVGHALILPRCASIHTLGMRFPIDVIFVDRYWRVIAWRAQVPPWRVLVGPIWGAWAVLEMAAGTLGRLGLKVGDQLVSEEVMGAERLDKSARH